VVCPVLSVVVQQPPLPSFDASVAPKMCGARGTTVCIGTGCALASVASSIQSCSSCRISGVILMRLCLVSTKACCKEEESHCFCIQVPPEYALECGEGSISFL
jgi:hypothetical protein